MQCNVNFAKVGDRVTWTSPTVITRNSIVHQLPQPKSAAWQAIHPISVQLLRLQFQLAVQMHNSLMSNRGTQQAAFKDAPITFWKHHRRLQASYGCIVDESNTAKSRTQPNSKLLITSYDIHCVKR
jgi:hypothetical protein